MNCLQYFQDDPEESEQNLIIKDLLLAEKMSRVKINVLEETVAEKDLLIDLMRNQLETVRNILKENTKSSPLNS